MQQRFDLRGRLFSLTDSDGSNNRRDNHRQRHTSSYHQVPLVLGDVLAFIAIVNLMGEIVQRY